MAGQSDLAEQLLDLAREDFAAAKALNGAEGVSASKSGFNAQQAVEKALKAALAGRGEGARARARPQRPIHEPLQGRGR